MSTDKTIKAAKAKAISTPETVDETVTIAHDADASDAVSNPLPVKENTSYKRYNANKTKWSELVSEPTRNLVYILRNNAEIRRFTAIGIINYLLQKGEITGTKRYIDFLWNKFTVKVDGFNRDYKYTEPFFLNCFVAAFSSFSASAQRIINAFCASELAKDITAATNVDEINNIIDKNEEYVNSSDEDKK